MFEHKGLYWSKVPGTEGAKTVEPDEEYVLPFGKGRIAREADPKKLEEGDTAVLISYGAGIHWGMQAAGDLEGRLEIVDLRTLAPLDEALILERVRAHGKCLVVTEEPLSNSFAESLAGRIQQKCFKQLDAPVHTLGAEDLPGIPVNWKLEEEMMPNAQKVRELARELLDY
jgi:2-oxoisovalerate dehydrogenase E1 component